MQLQLLNTMATVIRTNNAILPGLLFRKHRQTRSNLEFLYVNVFRITFNALPNGRLTNITERQGVDTTNVTTKQHFQLEKQLEEQLEKQLEKQLETARNNIWKYVV